MKITVRFIVIAGLAALVISIMIGGWYTNREQPLAQSFAHDLAGLQATSDRDAALQSLLAKCGQHCSRVDGKCTPEKCEIVFAFDNTILYSLRLAPPVHFGGSVKIQQGKVDHIAFVYRVACSPGQSSGINVVQKSQTGEALVASVHPIEGRAKSLDVQMTELANSSQRAAVFDLNFQCLSKIGGCAGASELAPSLAGARALYCAR